MSKSMDRMGVCALVLAAAAIAAPRFASGEEGQCPAKACAGHQFPILAQVPYIGHLFRAAGMNQPGHHVEEIERVGFDVEFCADGQCPIAFKLLECAKCADAKACCAAGECQACSECECPAANVVCGECHVGTSAACCCGTKCGCGGACQCAKHVAHAGPVCPAMFEHLLTLSAQNGALEAKLEARGEQAELVGEMLELAKENARLTAKLELMEAKAELVQAMLQMSLENEQLKAQVAELTNKRSSENVRTTAEAPQVRKPAR